MPKDEAMFTRQYLYDLLEVMDRHLDGVLIPSGEISNITGKKIVRFPEANQYMTSPGASRGLITVLIQNLRIFWRS